MKQAIIDILMCESFHVSDESGNDYEVVSRDDFNQIAERIVKLFSVTDPNQKEAMSTEDVLCKMDVVFDDGIRLIVTKVDCKKAMKEYASQFQSQPTDEDIENYFLNIEPRGYGCSFYAGLVKGAKDCRDGKIKPKK